MFSSDLQAALNQELEGVSRKTLSERSSQISLNYRAGGRSRTQIRDQYDALAYFVTRSPATYAATHSALLRFAQRCPSFTPLSALDVGAGPGTASWALSSIWPMVQTITQIDHNQTFLNLGRSLLASSRNESLRSAKQIPAELPEGLLGLGAFDLIVLSYTLAEFATPLITAVLHNLLLLHPVGIVFVEPGTPAGYRRIIATREFLLAQGLRVLAPCPHEAKCPLLTDDWCHFSQRLNRSRAHLQVKKAALSYEDEKFSYLVAVRSDYFARAQNDRLLNRPRPVGRALEAKLCTTSGTAPLIHVNKSDKELYRKLDKARWGDEISVEAVEEPPPQSS